MGSQGGEDLQQDGGWRTRQVRLQWAGMEVAGGLGGSTFACRYTRRNNRGVRQTTQPRVPVQGNKASKPLAVKTCESRYSGRNSQPHGRVCSQDPQGPRMYTNSPPGNQHRKGPI